MWIFDKKKKRKLQNRETITVKEAFEYQHLLKEFENVQFFCYDIQIFCLLEIGNIHHPDYSVEFDVHWLSAHHWRNLRRNDKIITVFTNKPRKANYPRGVTFSMDLYTGSLIMNTSGQK